MTRCGQFPPSSDFRTNYYSPACYPQNRSRNEASSEFTTNQNETVRNGSVAMITEAMVSSYDANLTAKGRGNEEEPGECLRQNSLLYLLLMLGTVWLSLSLYNFTKT